VKPSTTLYLAVLFIFVGLPQSASLFAQSAPSSLPQWQTAAGGKMDFEVASVKLDTSGDPPHADFPLDMGDNYPPTGGLFSVSRFSLSAYVGFAYKLTPYQTQSLRSQLPKWAAMERFDIQARTALANPTKDQMRLMMQSLLADRFKLAIHIETRKVPVFALVLAKPGKLGPQLVPHVDDPPCANAPPATPTERLPALCGTLLAQVVSGRMVVSARNLSMGYLANYLVVVGRLDRPILDETGLSGKFDLTMDAPDVPPPPGATVEPDPLGSTFFEALREQLGLKLESTQGPVEFYVIDHVEEPSPN
jgi:uncharacterized protein (TIGR03435 family)